MDGLEALWCGEPSKLHQKAHIFSDLKLFEQLVISDSRFEVK
jgi:hypothetical protein